MSVEVATQGTEVNESQAVEQEPQVAPEESLEQDLMVALGRRQADAQDAGDQPPENDTLGIDAVDDESTTQDPKDQAPNDDASTQDDDELPSNPDWSRFRNRNKELRNRIRELEAKLGSAPSEAKATDQQQTTDGKVPEVPFIDEVLAPKPDYPVQPKPAPTAKDTAPIPPDLAFRILARIENGDAEAEQYKAAAVDHITKNMSPSEARQVFLTAQQGGYGEQSQDIADLAREWMPMVNAGWNDRQVEAQAMSKAQQQREQAFRSAAEVLPGLDQPNSEVRQEYALANKELVQRIPNLWELPNAPSLVAEYVLTTRAVNNLHVMDNRIKSLTEENKKLKAQVQGYGGTQFPGQPPSSDGRTSPEAELAAALRGAGLAHA